MASASETDIARRELQYSTAEFRALSDLAQQMTTSPRTVVVARSLLRRPQLLGAFLRVWRLPTVEATVSRDQRDRLVAARFPVEDGAPLFSGWRAQSVLEVPADEQAYLAGKHRQALRTNLTRARAAGVTCHRATVVDEWVVAASRVAAGRGAVGVVGVEPTLAPLPGVDARYYVARDRDDVPVAHAGVARFGSYAVLFVLLSDRSETGSVARYALHTALALDLGRAGVRYLAVGSALRETAGNQYFAHLLGYQVRNLRLRVRADPVPAAAERSPAWLGY